MQGLLRALPSVDVLIGALAGESALAGVPRPRLAAAVREALSAERRRLLEAGGPAADVQFRHHSVVTSQPEPQPKPAE